VEGEDVVGPFLARAELTLERPPAALSDMTTDAGFLRTWPHRHGTDGFFATRLRRPG
jgi:16S rRNA (cytosine967-C5)-methyltransferase